MKWTILGGDGFVGRAIQEVLRQSNEEFVIPSLQEVKERIQGRHLGHVIYCIGLTADFRQRPLDAMQAHLCVLHQILTDNHCESITYLSSTRVYSGLDSTEEDRSLLVNPLHLSDLYNLSKLSGESLCLNSGIPARIVRLSNVYGHSKNPNFDSPLFIPSLLRESVLEKKLVFRSAPASAKDYIHLEDAAQFILLIASKGKSKIYNVAYGQNISNSQIAEVLCQHGIEVEFLPDAEPIWFHPIDTNRVQSEFFTSRHCLLNDLPELLNAFRKHFQP